MGLKKGPQSVAALGSTGRTADSGAAILRELTNTVAAGKAVVLVTVVATNRSVPRHAGAKMLVFADGRTSGTIGGGEMEARVVREATVAMADGRTRSLDISLVDPGRGDPGVCGGDVHLYLEPYMPVPTVFVVGCGHVGKAVVTLAKWLGFRVVATDDRPELVSADELPMADERHTGLVSEALDLHPITAETHVVVVTRNAGIDMAILPLLLATPARSIGVMGSQRRWDTTRRALLAGGVTDAQLARVRAPIGLELGAETPEEIAVSVMGEIVAMRRGAASGVAS